ncbi:MAG: Crp/Fnr family transcriptional regulator [Lawsonibacter sp.]|jgi:CRP/FNR family transcriptional regulator|nr:Crp/Fnr family transcriptional regulator [Lawsonibacter sp.]MCI9566488.1 Crp/Fnr family transcriptional regulator [Lawsonibacter sp.]
MDHELDFPAGIWEAFAQGRPPVRCSPGYLIYLQDTQATCFYYLRSGQVKSFLQSEDGGERVLNIYHGGSLFGEASFFDGLPRVSSAVALTPCQIVPIDREQVTQEFVRDPELALAMMKYLARTVRLLSSQVDQMAFRPARWRVASYLLSPGSLTCTQEDIAAAVSASRVTVSRILNEFAQRGWIRLGYRKIALLQPERLKELCRT